MKSPTLDPEQCKRARRQCKRARELADLLAAAVSADIPRREERDREKAAAVSP